MSRAWTAVLLAILGALAPTARTSEPAPVSPAEDPPPYTRPAFVPVDQLRFEDYAATNNLGNGAQFYSVGGVAFQRDPRASRASRDVQHRERTENPLAKSSQQSLRFPARSRRSPAVPSSPSLEAVDETPPRWSVLPRADKPQFVTAKNAARTAADAKAQPATTAAAANPRSNEIPADDASRDYLYRDVARVDSYPAPATRRRIVYYANLPEVVRHGPDYLPRGYEGYPGVFDKYPRETRFDYGPGPVAISSGDRFTYVPGGRGGGYTIVDAPPPQGYYDPYGRFPSPYQSQGGRAYYDVGRSREAVRPPPPPTATSYVDGPYRDYNPRQPAPWSMQVGARLLVNDDGRPMAPLAGRPGRPYYVESQRSGYPSRYHRTDDLLLT